MSEFDVIDVTTLGDTERQVVVMNNLTEAFIGPESKARELFPTAFACTPRESSPAAEQTPPGSLLSEASAFACGSAL